MTFSETKAEDKKGVLIFTVASRSIDPAHPRPPKRTDKPRYENRPPSHPNGVGNPTEPRTVRGGQADPPLTLIFSSPFFIFIFILLLVELELLELALLELLLLLLELLLELAIPNFKAD